MKIGINASFIRKQGSGIGQVSWNFIRALQKKLEKQVDFYGDVEIILYLEKDADIELAKNMSKKVIGSFYKRDDLVRKIFWEKVLLPREVKKDGCDVFFSLYQSPTVISGVKHYMLVHDAVWKLFPQYLNNARKKIYYSLVGKGIKKADNIITISQNSKSDIIRFFDRKKDDISVFPIDCDNVFKKRIFDKKKKEVLDKFKLKEGEYIFYVGGFDIRKNVDALLRSYGILYTRHNGKIKMPRLILAGSFHSNLVPLVSDVPHVADEIMRRNGIPRGYIESIGFVSQEDLPFVYAGAKIFCYPSLYEGFGLPVLEAMSVGCPIVTSNESSIPEVVSERSAILVDPRNDEKIAEGMLKVFNSEEEIKGMVNEAKKESRSFSWDKFSQKTMKLLIEK